jgi:Acetyltransferase (GNAT) domain
VNILRVERGLGGSAGDNPTSGCRENSVVAYAELTEIPPDVRHFLQERTQDQFFLTEAWFELLLRYSPPVAERPRIYVVRAREDRSVECVLFTLSAVSGPGHRARKLMSLTNFYTMNYAPVVHADSARAAAAVDALAHAIISERPAWDIIELRGLLMEAPTTRQLLQAFRKRGMLVDTYFQFENWYLPLSGVSAQAYFDSRPSQLRNTIGRKMRRVRRDHRLAFCLYRHADELQKGLEDYQAVYSRSWKEPEVHSEFIPRLLRKAAGDGGLRLGILNIDEHPVAAQIWLLSGNRATIYKLAYDERYAQLSVGSILTKMMFDHAIDVDHVAEVDFGAGSEAYKLEWMSVCRQVVAFIGFNARSPWGLFAATRHFSGRLLRQLLQSIRYLRRPLSPRPSGLAERRS